MHRIAVIALVTACTSPPLEERLDRADAALAQNCGGGTHKHTVKGITVDLDGKPVAGVAIDLTTAWTPNRAFPANGCRIGTAVSGPDGRFGPVDVMTATQEPIIVALATGAGLAPTVADKRSGCLFCTGFVEMTVVTVPEDIATAWREELYAGGMEYALNRGLVAYQFLERDRTPAARVKPSWAHDDDFDDARGLDPDSQVRFLSSDARTLATTGTTETLASGYAVVGRSGDDRGYFDIRGERAGLDWGQVGVIEATGWIYFETADVRQ